MLTIWSLCLLHKSGPVMCNVCLSCPYSAFSMEGVWVTLRKSLTRSPTSGSEGVKKNLCVTGPRKFMRFSQSSSGLCEAILVDVHLSTSIQIDRDMSTSRPVLLTWQTGAEVLVCFFKNSRTRKQSCVSPSCEALDHLYHLKGVHLCHVLLGCSMAHQVHCS